jgi:hypothetical protein
MKAAFFVSAGVLFIAVAFLALVGCGGPGHDESDGSRILFEERITLFDGRSIVCVVAESGVSCDWERR